MMRNPQGTAIITDQVTGAVQYRDTFTCGHCCRMRHVQAKQDPADVGGLCKVCMRLICPACVTRGHCDPLEEKIERAERDLHFHRWFLEATR